MDAYCSALVLLDSSDDRIEDFLAGWTLEMRRVSGGGIRIWTILPGRLLTCAWLTTATLSLGDISAAILPSIRGVFLRRQGNTISLTRIQDSKGITAIWRLKVRLAFLAALFV